MSRLYRNPRWRRITDRHYFSQYPRLFIADISNLASPTIRGSYQIQEFSSFMNSGKLLVANGLAYVAGYSAGLLIVDVHIPETPALASQSPVSAATLACK
jgi:hypothetical protein